MSSCLSKQSVALLQAAFNIERMPPGALARACYEGELLHSKCGALSQEDRCQPVVDCLFVLGFLRGPPPALCICDALASFRTKHARLLSSNFLCGSSFVFTFCEACRGTAGAGQQGTHLREPLYFCINLSNYGIDRHFLRITHHLRFCRRKVCYVTSRFIRYAHARAQTLLN